MRLKLHFHLLYDAEHHLLAIAIFLNTTLVVVETLLYCIATVSSICFWLTAFVTVFLWLLERLCVSGYSLHYETVEYISTIGTGSVCGSKITYLHFSTHSS